LSLAKFAPDLRVGLVDAGLRRDIPLGETVPPQIKPFLVHLGLWDKFASSGHCPSYRTLSAWGDSRLYANEFLLHPNQIGWRLDRTAFDRMLVDAAAPRVASLIKGRVVDLVLQGDRFRALLSDGAEHEASFVVDATGRAAALARKCGLRPVSADRLIGCCIRAPSLTDGAEGLMIESFADGWWYTAAIPGGDRVLICMTDADHVKPLRLSSAQSLLDRLADTRYVKQLADLGKLSERPLMRLAGSSFVEPSAALPLLCVGDAASCYDPISGQGIVKALCSAIFGSYAVGDWLRRADESGTSRYRQTLRREFSAYRTTLRNYYALERRWPESPFWRRRHMMRSATVVSASASS